MAYQSNLFFALGAAGVALLAIDRRRRRGRGPAEPGAAGTVFWIGFAAAGLAAIAGFGARDAHGLAYLSLQPVVLVAIAWLTTRFAAWPGWMCAIALAGLAIDSLLGIALHFWLQSYPLDLGNGWRGPLGLTSNDLLIGTTLDNWSLKTQHKVEFAGDLMAGWAPAMALLLLPLAAAGFVLLVRSAREPETRPVD